MTLVTSEEEFSVLAKQFDLIYSKFYLRGLIQKKLSPDVLQLSTIHEAYLFLIASTDNPTPSKIADLLSISKPAVSKMLAKLEKLQLIRKIPDTTDRRTYTIGLSSKGRDIYQHGLEYFESAIQEVFRRLTEEEKTIIVKTFKRFVEVLVMIDLK